MATTLKTLMADPRFALSPVTGVDDAVMSAPIPWAHSSDLPDPTPWIESGGLLLTDGLQFAGPDATEPEEYIARLREHGVLALGFARGVIHDDIPSRVVDSSVEYGLPLLEVSRRTPFMGIIRFVADQRAQEERQRLEWSLRAQRSVARAALRPDGLAAILRQLEKHLGCWVCLFDAAGAQVRISGLRPMPPATIGEVQENVSRVLSRGRAAAMRLSAAGSGEVTLQTLGQQGSLRGVLVVGTGEGALDRASNDLVDAVIALASIALEQSRALDDARRRLRSGVLELIAAGVFGVADRTVQHLWGSLPPSPIRVGYIASPDFGNEAAETLLQNLEALAERSEGALFFAQQTDGIVTVTSTDGQERLHELLQQRGLAAGFSAPCEWPRFEEGLAQARRARERATATASLVQFDDVASAGLIGHLEHTAAHQIARRMLEPLSSATAPSGLRHTLEVWLDNNAAWEASAKALGIHRHTLRARVDAAGALLGLDLDQFGARAELWSALQLTREEY